jgi:hypothetical protein
MALTMPASQAELDALKANLAAGHGAAAGQIRGRAPGIDAAYAALTQQLAADNSTRQQAMAGQAQAQLGGMRSAARELGLEQPPVPNSRADALRNLLSQNAAGSAAGWGTFLSTTGGIARERNDAAAQAMEESGRQMQSDLDRAWAEMMASGGYGGGGGRGGRGGSGGGDEGLLEYPKVDQGVGPTDGVIRGLIYRGRDEQARANKTPATYAQRVRAGLKKSGTDNTRPKGSTFKGSTAWRNR